MDEIKGGKGLWTYSGPYIIHEKRERDSYVLKELSGAILPGHVNVRRLRLFYYRSDHQTLRAQIPQARQQLSAIFDAPSYILNDTLERSRLYFRASSAELRSNNVLCRGNLKVATSQDDFEWCVYAKLCSRVDDFDLANYDSVSLVDTVQQIFGIWHLDANLRASSILQHYHSRA
ncbi:hypothetical protein GGU11DRAFT_751570 [Lentinula aff. detonsa]|nr:hypothetical protein GGU11DRAFT_751570 [Lentinula aff. detonsa]